LIELGIDAYCWHSRLAAGEVTIAEVLETTASLGVAYLQVDLGYARSAPGGIDAVRDRAEAAGLRLEANGGPIGRRYFEADSAAAAAKVGEWLREAEQLGCSSLLVHSGVYRPELEEVPGSEGEELAFVRDVLYRAAPAAERTGVLLMLENASDFKSDQLVGLFDEAGPSMSLFLDLTNPYNVFEDPIEAIRKMAPLARAGHVKDFVLTSNWTPDRFHRRGFSLEFRYPGEGMTNLAGALAELVRSAAVEPFPLAVEGLDSEPGVDDQAPRLQASIGKLRSTIAEVEETAAETASR
jgi:sugar phosphate isomerase/epimerase